MQSRNQVCYGQQNRLVIEVEIFSQIIGDTVEQNLRVLQAQRGFVLDSGFQESRKTSPSQVLGCGYGLM